MSKIILLIGLLLTQSVSAQQDPLQLVQQAADRTLKEVIEHKAVLNKDVSGIYQLVIKHVLPYFNFEAMTRSAMGKYWSRASEQQKTALVNEFRQLLVRTYGAALLNYSGQKIIYLPLRPSDDASRATVQTRVAEVNGGPEIPVDYRLQFVDDAWKVYDVVIDGVSLVSNYRTSFSGQIRRFGIDGLINELMVQNKG